MTEQKPMSKLVPTLQRPWAADIMAHLRAPLYRNGYALVLSAAITSGLGVIYWVLAARLYPPEVVGANAALISAMMLVAGIAQLNLMSVMVRFLPQAGRATKRLIGIAYLVCLSVAALAGSIFALVSSAWTPTLSFLGASPLTVAGFAFSCMAWCIFALQDSVLTGLRRATWVPVENALFALLKIGLLLVFVGWLADFGIFASWIVPVVIAVIPVNIIIFRWLAPQHAVHTDEQAIPIVPVQIMRYVAGNYLGAMCSLAATTMLPLMVAHMAGADANAFFYQPWLIAGSLQLVATNMATSLTVEAARDTEQLAAYLRRTFVQTLRLILPLVLLLVVGAPYVLHIFGGQYAAEGAVLLRLLALAAVPNIILALHISIARVQQDALAVVLAQGALCTLALGLSYALLPHYGITGVGWAWLISQTTVATLLIIARLRWLVVSSQ